MGQGTIFQVKKQPVLAHQPSTAWQPSQIPPSNRLTHWKNMLRASIRLVPDINTPEYLVYSSGQSHTSAHIHTYYAVHDSRRPIASWQGTYLSRGFVTPRTESDHDLHRRTSDRSSRSSRSYIYRHETCKSCAIRYHPANVCTRAVSQR